MSVEGVRVLRGPDWRGGDTDGGEGYVGTVIQLLSNHRVRVLWDMGQESTCSTGTDGKFDLRVFDTAQIGVCHPTAKCAVCGESSFYGMLWRCQDCAGCDLCPLCYNDDKHDLRHRFLRIDAPGANGHPVPKRKTSVKIRAIGMFPGSKVTRGKDWQWGDQDGGQGSEGEVQGYENVAPDSLRNLVRVQWPHGSANSYRLGFHGKVDLVCVEEEVGPFYYRDHLPVLDTTKPFQTSLLSTTHGTSTRTEPEDVKEQKHGSSGLQADETSADTVIAQPVNRSASNNKEERGFSSEDSWRTKDSGIVLDRDREDKKSKTDSLKTRLSLSSDSSPLELRENSKTGEATPCTEQEFESFVVGDKVSMKVSENMLTELQEDYGGCTEKMISKMGHTGEVVESSEHGAVSVRFKSSVYKFNPKVLIKVPALPLGSTVRIRAEEEEVKILNCRVGWKMEMQATIGKVGRVLKIDDDGDVLVGFGRHVFLFAPASCITAPDTKPDSLRIDSGGKPPVPASQTASNEKKTVPESEGSVEETKRKESEGLYRLLREKLQNESRAPVVRGDIRSLLSAVKKGDHVSVRAMCLANRSLLETEYKDLTPLVLACATHTENRQVVKTLLELGADVNHGLPPFRTPLFACMEGRSEELVEVLLEAGADPFAVDPIRHTYVHVAAAFNLPRSIRALAARGVDVNIKDDLQDTALHMAIENFKDDAVAALVQLENINLRVKNKRDFPALHLACLRANPRAVELILERDKSQVDEMHHGRDTPLHIAANNDHDECIRALVLVGGAHLNLKDSGSRAYAPIHLACIRAKFKASEALLELGADIQIQDGDGDTPLHLSIGGRVEDDIDSEEGKQECDRRVAISCMLISNGAYVDVENNKGRNPITYGVRPVREGIKQFMKHNEGLIKRKGSGGGGGGFGPGIKSLTLSQSSSSLQGQGRGHLKERLKGVGLPCGLCGTSKSDVTLQPCQHKCVCSTCIAKVTVCPLCDEKVKDKVVTGADDQTVDADACKQM